MPRTKVAEKDMGATFVNGLLKNTFIKAVVLDAAETVVPCLFCCVASVHTDTADLVDNHYRRGQNERYPAFFRLILIVRINYDPIT